MKRSRSSNDDNIEESCSSKKNRENETSESNIDSVSYCDVCKQNLTNVLKYKGHPIGSENEIITLTYNSISATYNENVHPKEKIIYKLTGFSVYDKYRHLCRLDDGLIEAGIPLMVSGYVKQVFTEDPSINGGIPTNNIGPVSQWYIIGFGTGETAMIGFSTEEADYYLLEPATEYKPLMKQIEQKRNLTKLLIEFLMLRQWESPSYEDLLQWFEDHEESKMDETILLEHAQFVCDQVVSFDAAGNSNDDILITTPCMRTLVTKTNVTLKSHQVVREFTSKIPHMTKTTSTDLVRDVFEPFFKDQIHTNEDWKSVRRERCGVCRPCQTPDCGRCSNCQHMSKFGGSGSSKQMCQARRCTKWAPKSEDSDSADEFQPNYTRVVAKKPTCSKQVLFNVQWISEELITQTGRTYYNSAQVGKMKVEPSDFVILKSGELNKPVLVAQIVYMWEEEAKQMFHARLFCRGSDTVLGETSNPREIFMTDACEDCLLGSILRKAQVERRKVSENWAHKGGTDRLEPQLIDKRERFFYCKFYNPKCTRFEDIIEDVRKTEDSADVSWCTSCSGCSNRAKKEALNIPAYINGSVHWLGNIYKIGTAVFLPSTPVDYKRTPNIDKFIQKPTVDPLVYSEYYRKPVDNQKGSNVQTPPPFNIGLIEDIYITPKKIIGMTIRKFYRPDDTRSGVFNSYKEDMNLVYWSDILYSVRFEVVKGKCYLAYGNGLKKPSREWTKEGPYRFYFTQAYDENLDEYSDVPEKAELLGITTEEKEEGKSNNEFESLEIVYELPLKWTQIEKPLACMDVFAGCGGLSEGLRQAGIAKIKWAIDLDPSAAHAFKLNNPDSMVYTADCNILLDKIMKNQQYEGRNVPQKGEVEMIVGGPPCQGFSGMNRYNTSPDSAFKNAMIVSFLSYCDYYRPHYIVIENVRNFVSSNQSIIFKLTLRCLLAIGYQVTFDVLQAGNYGVPQSRRRLFIMAAAPGYVLPRFPETENSFSRNLCQLAVYVGNIQYDTGVKWGASAPYRTLTVRDAIADLPHVESGSDQLEMLYDDDDAVSHFQRQMRADGCIGISDHICKEMSPLAQSRIEHIPTVPGADWRDLPNIVVELSNGECTAQLKYSYRSKKQKKGPPLGVCRCSAGRKCDIADHQYNTLIPWCLSHTADKHNNWAGLYGRLEWDGFFSTTTTNPEPMGKQGRVLHPEQQRILSVRECARSQGFPDYYQFAGTILNKYRQIGNAVPPPLALALGRAIQKAIISRSSNP